MRTLAAFRACLYWKACLPFSSVSTQLTPTSYLAEGQPPGTEHFHLVRSTVCLAQLLFGKPNLPASRPCLASAVDALHSLSPPGSAMLSPSALLPFAVGMFEGTPRLSFTRAGLPSLSTMSMRVVKSVLPDGSPLVGIRKRKGGFDFSYLPSTYGFPLESTLAFCQSPPA